MYDKHHRGYGSFINRSKELHPLFQTAMSIELLVFLIKNKAYKHYLSMNKTPFIFVILLSLVACQQSSKSTTLEIPESTENNPLICDPETGICEVPPKSKTDLNKEEFATETGKLTIIYFTDPICSSCWGIEPQLRLLKLKYGDQLDIEYKMGGLLPDWSYNSGGISKPSDVAVHWDEVSGHYDMPIDGDLWLEDPLESSYPPSIAFKAAQLQNEKKAQVFLREIREMVFLQKKNITKWKYIEQAAGRAGLDTELLKSHYENQAKQLFQLDLQLAKQYGVRGFPTLFLIDSLGNKEVIYGARPFEVYELAILKIKPDIRLLNYDRQWQSLFARFNSLTAREFSELSMKPRDLCEDFLNELSQEGKLEKFSTKNGAIWFRKS